MLTGIVPPQAVELVSDGLKFPEDFPTELRIPILKAMSPDKNHRHASVNQFIQEINNDEEVKIEEVIENEATNILLPPKPIVTNSFKEESKIKTAKPSRKWLYLIGVGFVCALIYIFVFLNKEDKSNINDEKGESRADSIVDNSVKPANPESNSEMIGGHEAVNLGIAGNLKWSVEPLPRYRDGEKLSNYSGKYAWAEISADGGYDPRTYQKKLEEDISGNPKYDAATANWGNEWRTPTEHEMKELVDKCTWQWIDEDGKYGYEITGPNGNSIFLPTNPYVSGDLDGEDDHKIYGSYWTASPYSKHEAKALFFRSNESKIFSSYPNGWRMAILPVSGEQGKYEE